MGRTALEWSVPAAGLRARELVRELTERYPALSRTVRSSRFLVNDRYLTDLDDPVRPGDEFAVHPPYGGG